MASTPPPAALEANSRGLDAMRRQAFAEAASHFRKALEADPTAIGLWANLAHACREAGDPAGEQAALESALDLDRRNIPTLIRLAQLHERSGHGREAMIQWEALLQLAKGIDNPSSELLALLDHARSYVDQHKATLEQGLARTLRQSIADLDPTARRRATAFVDHSLGLRPIYTNECAGLCYPFLPADEFFDESHFPWFANLAAATDAIRAELRALLADPGDALRPYVKLDTGTPQNKWSALDNQLDWGACFLWEYGQPNQPVLDRCPATAAALAAVPAAHIPGRAPSAFFSILKPHTRIPPHTGVSNTRAIIHLPLIVPDHCGFRVGGETRPWVEGVPFAFDDTIEHEAWNESDEVRAVLIFDVWNPHLSQAEQKVIADYYATVDDLAS